MSFVMGDYDSSQNDVISSVTPLLPCSSSLPFHTLLHLYFPLSHYHVLFYLQYSIFSSNRLALFLRSITNLFFPSQLLFTTSILFLSAFLPLALALRVEAIKREVPDVDH